MSEAVLSVRVKRGSGKLSSFHPTLPLSYIVGTFPFPGTWGPHQHTLDVLWEAPVPLYKPWFILGGTEFSLGNSYFSLVPGTTKTYRVVGERLILFIDPRNGHVAWHQPEKALLSNASVTIGDIRG